jgi:hypothetical protein
MDTRRRNHQWRKVIAVEDSSKEARSKDTDTTTKYRYNNEFNFKNEMN